jgi:hypothetical protein
MTSVARPSTPFARSGAHRGSAILTSCLCALFNPPGNRCAPTRARSTRGNLLAAFGAAVTCQTQPLRRTAQSTAHAPSLVRFSCGQQPVFQHAPVQAQAGYCGRNAVNRQSTEQGAARIMCTHSGVLQSCVAAQSTTLLCTWCVLSQCAVAGHGARRSAAYAPQCGMPCGMKCGTCCTA